jgi:hypothetical protein
VAAVRAPGGGSTSSATPTGVATSAVWGAELVRRKADLEGHRRWECAACQQRIIFEESGVIPDATTVCDVCGIVGQFRLASMIYG